MGHKSAAQAHRAGVAERCPAPAVPQSRAVDRALLGHDDQLLRDVARSILHTATHHQAQTLSLLRTVSGIGDLLRLVLRAELQDSTRVPRLQEVRASGRLVPGTQASAGKREGTSGTQSGNAHLTWAFAEATVLCLRARPAGQTSRTQREKNPGSGHALPRLGQQRGRPVDAM
jgi:transposase